MALFLGSLQFLLNVSSEGSNSITLEHSYSGEEIQIISRCSLAEIIFQGRFFLLTTHKYCER
jgi:hypothetical protein